MPKESSNVIIFQCLIVCNWSKGNYSDLTDSLKTIDWNLEFMFLDVNSAYNVFCNILNDHVQQFVPIFSPKHLTPSWERNIPSHFNRNISQCWRSYKDRRTLYVRQSPQALRANIHLSSRTKN